MQRPLPIFIIIPILIALCARCSGGNETSATDTAIYEQDDDSPKRLAQLRFAAPPNYVTALSFSSGVAAVANSTTVGYIDTQGRWLANLSEQRAPSAEGNHGLSDLEKITLADPGSIVSGATPMMVGEINIGLLLLRGSGIRPSVQLNSFNGELAAHKVNDVCGYRNKNGDYVVRLDYDECRPFSEDRAAVKTEGRWGYIDSKGVAVIPPKFMEAGDFHGGLAVVKDESDSYYGYVDSSGTMVIPAEFTAAELFAEDVALVRSGGRYGFIDRSGKYVIQPEFAYAGPFAEGLAVFCPGSCSGDNSLKGYINKQNKYVINPKFTDAGTFNGGLAPAQLFDKWGYIDVTGKFVIAPQFSDAWPFEGKFALVKSNELFGLIDRSGRFVVPAVCDVLEPYSYGFALACVGQRCGYLAEPK